MSDEDLPSVTGGPPPPRLPTAPPADEPRGTVARLVMAVLNAAVEEYLPVVVFLVLGGIVGLLLW